MAVYAPGTVDSGNDNGRLTVYRMNGNDWEILGEAIEGEFPGDGYVPGRNNVSISGNGNTVAFGARYNDGNGENSGHARVFNIQNNTWIQIGEDINGEAEGDLFGTSVSLSHDGETISIGARNNDGSGPNAGHVRIYGLPLVVSTSSINQINFAIYPNPADELINIQLDENNNLKEAILFNSLGQKIITTKDNTINVSTLPPGAYLVEVKTINGNAYQNLIIE